MKLTDKNFYFKCPKCGRPDYIYWGGASKGPWCAFCGSDAVAISEREYNILTWHLSNSGDL